MKGAKELGDIRRKRNMFYNDFPSAAM